HLDLALLGELAADTAEVLVVDDVDLVPAIRAGLAPACAGSSLAITPAAGTTSAGARLLPAARFTCHLLRHLLIPKKVPAKQGLRGVYRAKSRSTARHPHGRWASSSIPGAGSTARLPLERDVVVPDATAGRRRGEIGGVGRDVAL